MPNNNEILEQKRSEALRLRKILEAQQLKRQIEARENPRKPFAQDLLEGTWDFFTKGSIAENVPLVGPAGRYVGERFQAGTEAAFGDETYGEALQRVQRSNIEEKKRFEEESPGAATVAKIGGAAAVPPLLSTAPGVAGAAGRIGIAAAESLADSALSQNNLGQQQAIDAGMGAGIQGAIEAVPVVGRGVKAVGGAVAPAIEWLGKKAGRIMTGVDEEAISRYANRRPQMETAPDMETLKGDIDLAVGKRVTAVEDAKEALRAAQRNADDSLRATKYALQNQSVSKPTVDRLLAHLDEQKEVLGEMSDKADEVLAKSGATFKKDDLLALIDQVGKTIGAGGKVLVSDESMAAAQKLYAQRQRIADGYGKIIPAGELRDILKDLRRDIKYNQFAGEFNDTLNAARKEFAYGISNALKNQVPEYAEAMSKMSELSEALGMMSKKFGTPERAAAGLERVVGDKDQFAKDLVQKYEKATGSNFLDELSGIAESRGLLEQGKYRDITQDLIPNEFGRVKAAEQALSKAEETLEPIRRLTPQRTYSAINRQALKRTSPEDRYALEALGELEGKDFVEMAKDRAAMDAFGKDYTRGARMAVTGGTIGAAIGSSGGPVGASIGGAIGSYTGATLDKYGGEILKKLIATYQTTPQVIEKYATALTDAAKKSNAALTLTHQMIAARDPEYAAAMGDASMGKNSLTGVIEKLKAERGGGFAERHLSVLGAIPDEALGKYGPILQSAAQKGTTSFLATHGALLNNDPEYKKLIEGAGQ